ncbi:cellulose biosynthesis protein BcsQ [Stutzerimonas tarimensis]|uniref:Cellulose biosynthesis protein BcsQ n=1 Tax=Stutzerimonas tarimensis TaxID=1507735 RepID=A0ABV7T7H3_9GAMM
MPLICLSSPKGGVGKTTLTANLAFALRRQGMPVTVIDFDVQNTLRLHFGIPLGDPNGFVAHALDQSNWRHHALAGSEGVGVIPYGRADELQRMRFERRLSEDPGLAARGLQHLLAVPDMVVLADTSPGPSPALKALDRLADIRLVVLMPDAASASLMPQIEQGHFLSLHQPVHYILNQVDRRRRLNQDTTEMFRARLGTSLLGMVRRDEALAESLAMQLPVFASAPACASAHDIGLIGQQIGELIETLQQPLYEHA